MATTISNATLTVKIIESVVLNGQNQGASNTLTISSIDEVYKRIVECPTSEKTLISFDGSNPGAGTFVDANSRYIRITNKDDTNYIKLNIEGDSSTDFTVRVDAGASFIITGSVVDYGDISGATLEDLTAIKCTANSAAVDVELFIASV